jgi:hypothetical protein
MTERPDRKKERMRDKPRNRFAPMGDRVHELIFGSDDYCRCVVPKPDSYWNDLDSDEPWCWTCRKSLDPTTLISRLIAFIA